VTPEAIVDPTGCGDAYRGGLLYGLRNGIDWELTGRLASLIGSLKIAQRGAQNYAFTADEIDARFKRRLRHALPLIAGKSPGAMPGGAPVRLTDRRRVTPSCFIEPSPPRHRVVTAGS
jgi:hypothetical protein